MKYFAGTNITNIISVFRSNENENGPYLASNNVLFFLWFLSTPLFCYLVILVINQLKMTILNGYNVFHVNHQFGYSLVLINFMKFNWNDDMYSRFARDWYWTLWVIERKITKLLNIYSRSFILKTLHYI